MNSVEIKRILTAPITLLRWSTGEEKGMFPDAREGDLFCTFGLESDQTFVGRIPLKENTFTFRPLHNCLPYLMEIEWTGKKNIANLGYTTTCWVVPETPRDEHAYYEEILSPKRDTLTQYPATKIAFKYYTYHPLLQEARRIQMAVDDYRKKEEILTVAKNRLGSILFSENNLAPVPFREKVRE